MNKKVSIIIVVAFLILIVVPVVVAQTAKNESREWVGVTLDEVTFEEVTFYNQEQGLELAGMLFVPEDDSQSSEEPYPAVVFIHGSMPSFRENRFPLTWAKHLTENGVIVFIPDKRGAGNSEGDAESASFEDLSRDAIAAVHYLQERDDLSISRIGILGASQGGIISPLTANLSDEISFIINLSGTALPIREQLLYEENNNLREMGLLPGISNLIAIPSAWSIRELRQKTKWDAIGDFDPLPYWKELDVEALVLYGREDTNVQSEKSEALLNSLDKANITVTVYDGSGHNLETPLGQGNQIIRQEALDDVLNFILSINNQEN